MPPLSRTKTKAAHSPHGLPLYPIHASTSPHWAGEGGCGGGGEGDGSGGWGEGGGGEGDGGGGLGGGIGGGEGEYRDGGDGEGGGKLGSPAARSIGDHCGGTVLGFDEIGMMPPYPVSPSHMRPCQSKASGQASE